ncbi:MAG: tryptophan--tRNA ligase [Alphaproteobacteria bacterium]|nr:tryptophan--tRNA ligase [Alphaproteobacteria bacterium]
MRKKIISGIQPTQVIHLGNYLGAIKSWLKCIDEGYDARAFIADLHAITVFQDPKKLSESIFSLTATYLACGLDYKKCPIFVQSSVPEHSELGWILGCFTPNGWLNRMTQYKEKSSKYKENSSLGLYGYPVLQAADILLYQVDYVPVGEDQKQHVELTRDIAEAFNRQTNSNVFKIPEHLIPKENARIMSLRDGTKKMSKSDESEYSRISITDDAEIIAKKFKKAKSDAIREVYYDKEKRPEISNLIGIYSGLSGVSIKDVEKEFVSKGTSDLKEAVAEVVIDTFKHIKTEYDNLIKDKDHIKSVLEEGRINASEIAQKTLRDVKQKVGFV